MPPADAAPLLRPVSECPQCGKRPRQRITEAMRAAAMQMQPDTTCQTLQCHWCGHVYPQKAEAFQGAA